MKIDEVQDLSIRFDSIDGKIRLLFERLSGIERLISSLRTFLDRYAQDPTK
jgi:hypothetical protein